jgi:hypothetical protein
MNLSLHSYKLEFMITARVLDREEYIEQSYFFRVFRERLADNLPAQDILTRVHEELLSTTRLPYAVQFIATELKHTGLLGNGFVKLPHYFTMFQAFVIGQAELETSRFPMSTALLALEREASYKAEKPTKPGLFIYQFETIARNRLGYLDGLGAMSEDPLYDADWRSYINGLPRHVGDVDFCDLVYLRSDLYTIDQRRANSAFEPSVPVIFGEKEGKIAKASRGRDPLYLFAALQRHLAYPEVPRFRDKDDGKTKLDAIMTKLRELEMRIKLTEGELRGNIDLSQFGKPDLLKDDEHG